MQDGIRFLIEDLSDTDCYEKCERKYGNDDKKFFECTEWCFENVCYEDCIDGHLHELTLF